MLIKKIIKKGCKYLRINTNVDWHVIYLRTVLNKYFLTDDILVSRFGIISRQLSVDCESDLLDWMFVMNNSYQGEKYESLSDARHFLMNHLFLDKTRTYLFEKQGGVFASVSVGEYKNNHNVVGLFRIGVVENEKGNSYGDKVVLNILSKVQSEGYKICEDVVSSKRLISLNMHQKCGFFVVEKRNTVVFQDSQSLNWIQAIRLKIRTKRAIDRYQEHMYNKYIKFKC